MAVRVKGYDCVCVRVYVCVCVKGALCVGGWGAQSSMSLIGHHLNIK